ncbi:hypothetical protein IAT38_006687 [Cryptococcus sp. DSM 104549]
MLLPEFNAPLPKARVIYRRYLQHLRILPDPEVWRVLQPKFRKLLETPGPLSLPPNKAEPEDPVVAEELRKFREVYREARRVKALRTAREEYNHLRAAVACHPHALARLLAEAYGQRGAVRWERLRRISEPWFTVFHNIVPTTPLPPPLIPVAPPPNPDENRSPRARKVVPQRVIDAAEKAKSERMWRLVKPPLIIPSPVPAAPIGNPPYSTPWNNLTERQRSQIVVANLRHIIGIRAKPRLPALDLSPLSPHMRRIFPKNLRDKTRIPEPPYTKPRPGDTRKNPRTWKEPRILTPRLLRRIYERLWSGLVWVRPVGRPNSAEESKWERCSYEDMIAWDMDDGEIDEKSTEEKSIEGKSGSKPDTQRRKAKVGNAKRAAKKTDEAYKLRALPLEHTWTVVGEEDLRWLDVGMGQGDQGKEQVVDQGDKGKEQAVKGAGT